MLQIRGVPDDVWENLHEQARQHGQSLTAFALRELTYVAQRTAVARANVAEVAGVQARIGAPAGREDILEALRDGRGE